MQIKNTIQGQRFLQGLLAESYLLRGVSVLTRMKVDLINFTRKIAVEVQGDQHNQYNKFFHGGSRDKYLASIKRDMKKISWLEMNEFQVLEIETKDIENLSRSYIFDTRR